MAAATAAAGMMSKNFSCPHLMTLADLSPQQIMNIVILAKRLKLHYSDVLPPRQVWPKTVPSWRQSGRWEMKNPAALSVQWPTRPQSLRGMTISMLFSKRSTRTRVAAESSCALLGGHALFLGRDDIQLGVNESLQDTARVLSGMTQGIFARVGDHSEIEELARYASVPVINALSSLWHPTQVLADLQTLTEVPDYNVPVVSKTSEGTDAAADAADTADTADTSDAAAADDGSPNSPAGHGHQDPERAVKRRMRKLTIAYVGDSANVLHDMLVTYPRLGHTLRVASPEGYRAPEAVMQRVNALGCARGIVWTADPREAVHGADVVVTDTWVSMGQEAEYEARVRAFQGYQVTEQLCREGGARPDWRFLHCLPRKSHEVDDEVFYGPRSLVWGEAENRKWTIMALFHMMFGRRTLNDSFKRRRNVNTRQIMDKLSSRTTKAGGEGPDV